MPWLKRLFMQAGKTLSARKWQAAFTPEGCLDIGRTLGRIQRGVSASLGRESYGQLARFNAPHNIFSCSILFGGFRGSIHRLEEKFGNFYLDVLIRRVHLMKEIKYDSVEGSPFLLFYLSQ